MCSQLTGALWRSLTSCVISAHNVEKQEDMPYRQIHFPLKPLVSLVAFFSEDFKPNWLCFSFDIHHEEAQSSTIHVVEEAHITPRARRKPRGLKGGLYE